MSSQGAAAAGGKPQPLLLRDLASGGLWLRACRRAYRAFHRSLQSSDAAAIETNLTQLGQLVRFGHQAASIGGLRPVLLRGLYLRTAQKWYAAGLKEGLDQGLIVPGRTRGVHAEVLLQVRMDASTTELLEKAHKQRLKLEQLIQKGMAGSGHLYLEDEDLMGLTEHMKSIWAPQVEAAGRLRKAKYKVPVGRDSLTKISAFCQNAATRAKVFEAYYKGFGEDVDEAALELLRARKELAQKLGFKTWADYENRALASGDASGAHRLMDRAWKDAQPSLKELVQRMESLSATSSRSLASRAPVAHQDEAFFRALITRESDTWKMSEFLPAEPLLPRLFDIVGRAYGVRFAEVQEPDALGRLATGWHKSVRIYEVHDGASQGVASSKGAEGVLGFVYVDLYQRTNLLGRPASMLAGAQLLCPGHTYLSMNLEGAPYGQKKLLHHEEVVAMAHELGHAVHMLCFGSGGGTPQDFDDLPLDVKELPSTLAETIALQSGAISQYARHWQSGGPPPDSLIQCCQRDAHFFTRYLQSAHVTLGLHGEMIDPHSCTPAEFRRASVALWQRYSPFKAHPSFTPMGEEGGIYLGQGANQVAYLMCYMRVDQIMHGGAKGGAGASAKNARARPDAAQKWLGADFAGRVRAQLLDRAFTGPRLAALLPTLSPPGQGAAPPAHPLPPLPDGAAGLFSRLKAAGA